MEKKRETLNDLREQIEKYRRYLLDLDTLGDKIVEILTLRDKIKELSSKLEERGIDLSVEKSKLDTLDHMIKDRPGFIWKKLKETVDPVVYREQNKIPTANWWWYLDQNIKREKQRRRQKWISRGLIGAAVIACLYFVFTYVVPKPEPYVACMEEASRLLDEGKINPALETYQKAIRINPQQGSAYLMVGVIYEFLGEKEKAKNYFLKAKERYNSLQDFYLQRGMTWLRLGEFSKAEEDAEKALEINPKSAEAHFLLGNAYEAQEKIAQAIAEFSIVSDMDADPKLTVIARYKIGMLALRGISSPQEESGQ